MIFFENRRVYFWSQQVAGPSESGAPALANSSSAPKTAAELKQAVNAEQNKAEKQKLIALYESALNAEKNEQRARMNSLKGKVENSRTLQPITQTNNTNNLTNFYRTNPEMLARVAQNPRHPDYKLAVSLSGVDSVVPNAPEVSEHKPVFEIQDPVERVEKQVSVKKNLERKANPVLRRVSRVDHNDEARERVSNDITLSDISDLHDSITNQTLGSILTDRKNHIDVNNSTYDPSSRKITIAINNSNVGMQFPFSPDKKTISTSLLRKIIQEKITS